MRRLQTYPSTVPDAATWSHPRAPAGGPERGVPCGCPPFDGHVVSVSTRVPDPTGLPRACRCVSPEMSRSPTWPRPRIPRTGAAHPHARDDVASPPWARTRDSRPAEDSGRKLNEIDGSSLHRVCGGAPSPSPDADQTPHLNAFEHVTVPASVPVIASGSTVGEEAAGWDPSPAAGALADGAGVDAAGCSVTAPSPVLPALTSNGASVLSSCISWSPSVFSGWTLPA